MSREGEIINLLKIVLGFEPPTDKDLFDYGLDSVGIMQLISLLETNFMISIEDSNLIFSKYQTVDTINKLVESLIEKRTDFRKLRSILTNI